MKQAQMPFIGEIHTLRNTKPSERKDLPIEFIKKRCEAGELVADIIHDYYPWAGVTRKSMYQHVGRPAGISAAYFPALLNGARIMNFGYAEKFDSILGFSALGQWLYLRSKGMLDCQNLPEENNLIGMDDAALRTQNTY